MWLVKRKLGGSTSFPQYALEDQFFLLNLGPQPSMDTSKAIAAQGSRYRNLLLPDTFPRLLLLLHLARLHVGHLHSRPAMVLLGV